MALLVRLLCDVCLYLLFGLQNLLCYVILIFYMAKNFVPMMLGFWVYVLVLFLREMFHDMCFTRVSVCTLYLGLV